MSTPTSPVARRFSLPIAIEADDNDEASSIITNSDPNAVYEPTEESVTLKTDLFELHPSGFVRTATLEAQLETKTSKYNHSGNNSRNTQTPRRFLESLNNSTLLQLGVLGRGASGIVAKVVHKPSLHLLALKVIDVGDKNKRLLVIKELKQLDTAESNPYIVDFFGAFYENGQVKLALEYMNRGSLQFVLSEYGPLAEPLLAAATKQILLGLQHLHKNHAIHRDIKPGNVLLDWTGACKLSDFGILAELQSTLAQCETFVGTTIYMSPERLTSAGYSYVADIWSVGMSLLTLATGHFPLSTVNGYWGIVMQLTEQPPPALPKKYKHDNGQISEFSDDFIDFVRLTLIKEQEKRPGATALLAHPWVARSRPMDELSHLWPKAMCMKKYDREKKHTEAVNLRPPARSPGRSRRGSVGSISELAEIAEVNKEAILNINIEQEMKHNQPELQPQPQSQPHPQPPLRGDLLQEKKEPTGAGLTWQQIEQMKISASSRFACSALSVRTAGGCGDLQALARKANTINTAASVRGGRRAKAMAAMKNANAKGLLDLELDARRLSLPRLHLRDFLVCSPSSVRPSRSPIVALGRSRQTRPLDQANPLASVERRINKANKKTGALSASAPLAAAPVIVVAKPAPVLYDDFSSVIQREGPSPKAKPIATAATPPEPAPAPAQEADALPVSSTAPIVHERRPSISVSSIVFPTALSGSAGALVISLQPPNEEQLTQHKQQTQQQPQAQHAHAHAHSHSRAPSFSLSHRKRPSKSDADFHGDAADAGKSEEKKENKDAPTEAASASASESATVKPANRCFLSSSEYSQLDQVLAILLEKERLEASPTALTIAPSPGGHIQAFHPRQQARLAIASPAAAVAGYLRSPASHSLSSPVRSSFLSPARSPLRPAPRSLIKQIAQQAGFPVATVMKKYEELKQKWLENPQSVAVEAYKGPDDVNSP